jgi:hypothetical protein
MYKAKSGRPRGDGHSCVGKLFLNCLLLEEAPCHAKRAESRPEQHHGRSTIRNAGTTADEEVNVGDAPSTGKGHRSGADNLFVGRNAKETIELLLVDRAVLDQRAAHGQAGSSQVP